MATQPQEADDRVRQEIASRRRRSPRNDKDLDRDTLEAVREILGLEPLPTKRKGLDEDEPYANPTPQPWGWIIGGAIVVGAGWLLYRRVNPSWACPPNADCTRSKEIGGLSWSKRTAASLSFYSSAPTNIHELVVADDAPGYTRYVHKSTPEGFEPPSRVEGVGMCWLP